MPRNFRKNTAGGLHPVGADVLAVMEHVPPPLTPIQERLLSMPADDEQRSILYQHSVLAQRQRSCHKLL
jgi:hypothetical protein